VIGLLPWERWLPPYVFGPFLCLGSIAFLVWGGEHSWWKVVLLAMGGSFGAWGTWTWLRKRENVFAISAPSKRPEEKAK
jgi:hypothetical protein